jgi:hypothetical protein
MSGPKRNPDKLNTIGIVVVGICGAVLVYVTIVALQAFYMEDTAGVQTMADYGGQETQAAGHKADEMRNITEVGKNAGGTVHMKIEDAMQLIVRDAAKDPSHLVPALPPSTKPTIEPTFGRPKPLGQTAAPAAEGSGAGSAAASGAGSAAGSGAGSAAPAAMQPTGAGNEPKAVPGAGSVPGASTTVPAVGGGNGH